MCELDPGDIPDYHALTHRKSRCFPQNTRHYQICLIGAKNPTQERVTREFFFSREVKKLLCN